MKDCSGGVQFVRHLGVEAKPKGMTKRAARLRNVSEKRVQNALEQVG